MGLAHAQRTRQAPFFIKNVPYRYSSYRIKNMSKGITSFKSNKCPHAYKLRKDKVPVIPFLSLSSEGGARQQRAKGAPRRGARSRRHQENILVPGKELEDEAAGRQYATKASVSAYSELTAATRLLRLLRPSYASHPRRQRGAPRWRAWRGWPPAGRVAEGGAARSVGVGILPLDSLVAAVLLVIPA